MKPPGSNTPCWVQLLGPWLVGGQILNEKVPLCPKKLGVFSDGETLRETGDAVALFWKVLLWPSSPVASVWTGVLDVALCGGSSNVTKPFSAESSSDCFPKKKKMHRVTPKAKFMVFLIHQADKQLWVMIFNDY